MARRRDPHSDLDLPKDQHYLVQVGEKTFYADLPQHRHGRRSASVRIDGHKARHCSGF